MSNGGDGISYRFALLLRAFRGTKRASYGRVEVERKVDAVMAVVDKTVRGWKKMTVNEIEFFVVVGGEDARSFVLNMHRESSRIS